MNSKVLLAALGTGVASFLLGWVVFGMALHSYYDANMLKHEGLMKATPNMIALAIGNLAWGLLIAWALFKMGVGSAAAGFLPGAIIGLLFTVSFDMFMVAFMMMFKSRMFVVVDVLVNTVMGGVLGAIAGAILGMGSKTSTVTA